MSLDCFTTYANKDSPGNDLKRIMGVSPEILAEVCKKDPNCMGFNADGWMKHSIYDDSSLSPYSGTLYVKKPECGAHPRRSKLQNTSGDSSGMWVMVLFLIVFIFVIIAGIIRSVALAYGISKGVVSPGIYMAPTYRY